MSKRIVIFGITIILIIISGLILYKIIGTNKEKNLNEITKNLVEISEFSESNEDAVTDQCLEEWNDYNEYISERIEQASSNISAHDARYILKDVYGYIEIYYLDEDNNEYLYKKTDISTEYLTEEDRDDLKVGIEVVGLEELNKMLEDFE